MITTFLHWLYCLSAWQIILLVLLVLLLYTLLKGRYGKTKYWKMAVGILLLCAVLVVAHITLGQRLRQTEIMEPKWIPFYSYYEVLTGGNQEIYRTNFMNFLMFFPLGLLSFETFPKGWKYRTKILLSVFIFMLFSICIEYLQHRFALGLPETDDVIHNTLGAFMGSCTGKKMTDLCSKRKNR